MNTSFPHLQTTTSAHDLQLNLRTPCLVHSADVSGMFIPPPFKQQALSFTVEESLFPSAKTTQLSLARQLGRRPRQVEVWLQKWSKTEVDCEFLKRCCENLTEENMSLQKEVRELRSLKLPPQFYRRLSPPPPTTLTVCPSCEHPLIPYYPTSSAGPVSGYTMFNDH